MPLSDYIDRKMLLRFLADIQFGESPTGRANESHDRQEGRFVGLEDAISAVEGMPSAFVRPLAPGHWERPNTRPNSYNFRCSICGRIAHQVTGNNGRKEKIEPICTYQFCPNCGATMIQSWKEVCKSG